jgi:hypothetical protein
VRIVDWLKEGLGIPFAVDFDEIGVGGGRRKILATGGNPEHGCPVRQVVESRQ